MYEAFPHSDYYGSSVTMSGIQALYAIALQLPDLGNPRLVYALT